MRIITALAAFLMSVWSPGRRFSAAWRKNLVGRIGPQTVFAVGCAKGFLVEALRDRSVQAFGLDISPYAISQVREDLRLYCWVGSALDLFPQRYDLIVCIEVLEHLSRPDAESAVATLCRYADDVLFSSTPDDLTEPTHVTVQPVEYWAELFAHHGFYREMEKADFIITSHIIEHLPDLIAAFLEWDRIVSDGGYVFMIVPHKGALPEDAGRALTRLEHFVEDYHRGMTWTRPVARAVWRLCYRFDGWLLSKAHTAMDRPWAESLYRWLHVNLYGKLGPFQLLYYALPWDLHSISSTRPWPCSTTMNMPPGDAFTLWRIFSLR
jgi:SAM-dependent methyltransferase